MGERIFKLQAIHGETDKAAAQARILTSHRVVYPAYRTAEDLLVDDEGVRASWGLEDGAEPTKEQLRSLPSNFYPKHPQRPPEPEEPVCDVVATFITDAGERLSLEFNDWDEAATIAKASELKVKW